MYRFETKVWADKHLNGEVVVVLEPSSRDKWRESKGQVLVEFLSSKTRKWVYNTEIKEVL